MNSLSQRRSAARAGFRLVLVGSVAAFAACGSGGGEAAAANGTRRGGGPEGADRIFPVEVAVAELGVAARTVTVSGTVEPIRSVGVNSQLAGALTLVAVEEGDRVREGQVLARLDDRELRAQVASAEASLELAESTYERAEQLRQARVITDAEYERDRAARAAARAQLQQLRTRLTYSTIRSPLSGVVTEKRVEAGDLVAPQTRLFTVADISTMVVRVPVSERDVTSLHPGVAVDVSLDALPGRMVSGRIRRVFPSADTATRLVPVEVALTGAATSLVRPGFLARVVFSLEARQDALLIPASALLGGSGGRSVFVVERDTVRRRAVQTGLTTQGRVEILAGLDRGERVVIAGHNTLRDGAAVRIVAAPLGDTARRQPAAAGTVAPGGE